VLLGDQSLKTLLLRVSFGGATFISITAMFFVPPPYQE